MLISCAFITVKAGLYPGGTADDRTFQNGDYGAAVRTYVVALTDLAPWYASPLLFTGQQVVDSGLLSL